MLSKMFGLQTQFGRAYLNKFVAISDSGEIIRPRKNIPELDVVAKADQVSNKIREQIKSNRKNILDKISGFTQEELNKIKDFLLLEDKKARNPNQLTAKSIISHDDFDKFVAQQIQVTQPKEEKVKIQEVKAVASTPSCTKCGKEMIFRKGKEGKSDFYGCSGFPKCRNMISIV